MHRARLLLCVSLLLGVIAVAAAARADSVMITDATGRIVESLGGDTRLTPILNGVPSELQYNVGSSVPPGDYTLRLAMAEGGRVGTVEHRVHASLADT